MGSSLTGTVALVTGASSGIGAATAHHLADNGATVAVVARRKDRLDTLVADIEQSGGTAFAVEVDMAEVLDGGGGGSSEREGVRLYNNAAPRESGGGGGVASRL